MITKVQLKQLGFKICRFRDDEGNKVELAVYENEKGKLILANLNPHEVQLVDGRTDNDTVYFKGELKDVSELKSEVEKAFLIMAEENKMAISA